MKTRKDLDRPSKDVKTQRTCQGGLELFHFILDWFEAGRLGGHLGGWSQDDDFDLIV